MSVQTHAVTVEATAPPAPPATRVRLQHALQETTALLRLETNRARHMRLTAIHQDLQHALQSLQTEQHQRAS